MSYFYTNANNATTVLENGISSTATSMVVAAGTGLRFPPAAAGAAGGIAFYCTITESSTLGTNEIVKVIYKVGDVFTIVRQQQGTQAPPQGWPAGSIVSQLITAGDFQNFVQRSEYVGNVTVPIGGLIWWPSTSVVPDGSQWMLCNGDSRSPTLYPELFATIGYTYGQVIFSDRFYIPDMRGCFLRAYANTGYGYRQFGTYQSDDYQSHTHDCYKMLYQSATQNGGGNHSISWAYSTAYTTENYGSTAWNAAETRPYNIAFDAYIRYK